MTTSAPRYVVHDEYGPLRAFWTRQRAKQWMDAGMRLVVLPRVKRTDFVGVVGAALF